MRGILAGGVGARPWGIRGLLAGAVSAGPWGMRGFKILTNSRFNERKRFVSLKLSISAIMQQNIGVKAGRSTSATGIMIIGNLLTSPYAQG